MSPCAPLQLATLQVKDHIHPRAYAHANTHTHIYTHTHRHSHKEHTHKHTRKHTNTNAHTHTRTTHSQKHTNTHKHTRTETHTHTHTTHTNTHKTHTNTHTDLTLSNLNAPSSSCLFYYGMPAMTVLIKFWAFILPSAIFFIYSNSPLSLLHASAVEMWLRKTCCTPDAASFFLLQPALSSCLFRLLNPLSVSCTAQLPVGMVLYE